MKGNNERMKLIGDHFERIFRILDLAEEKGGLVEDVCRVLGECYPSGDYQDEIGGTARQLVYIRALTSMDEDQYDDLVDVVLGGGGLSLAQCGHLIDTLKERKRVI